MSHSDKAAFVSRENAIILVVTPEGTVERDDDPESEAVLEFLKWFASPRRSTGGLRRRAVENIGHLTGICIACGAPLRNDNSLDRALGPVCTSRLGNLMVLDDDEQRRRRDEERCSSAFRDVRQRMTYFSRAVATFPLQQRQSQTPAQQVMSARIFAQPQLYMLDRLRRLHRAPPEASARAALRDSSVWQTLTEMFDDEDGEDDPSSSPRPPKRARLSLGDGTENGDGTRNGAAGSNPGPVEEEEEDVVSESERRSLDMIGDAMHGMLSGDEELSSLSEEDLRSLLHSALLSLVVFDASGGNIFPDGPRVTRAAVALADFAGSSEFVEAVLARCEYLREIVPFEDM